MLTVVIDTNILIDAWKDDYSYQRRIMDLVMEGKIIAVVSDKILKENNLILNRLVNNRDHYDLVQKFFGYIRIVHTRKEVRIIEWDPDDDKFLSCAAEVGADYIISSDNHLLDVDEFRGTKIVSPKEFWLEYKNSQGEEGNNLEWANWAEDILRKK